MKRIVLTLITFCLAAAALGWAQDAPFKVQRTWTIGGDGGWDYLTLDAPAHLLYIARGNRVQVVDTQTGKLAGEIAGLKAVHGVALDPDGHFGYISDGGANQVRIFDRATRRLTGAIDAGSNPDGILFEPKTRRVLAFNARSKNVTVIDTTSKKVIATLPLSGNPEFPQADGTGTVFVNIEDTGEIARIDAAAPSVTATWSIAPCEEPSGLALDAAHGRLFSVCGNREMAVVDTTTGKVVATPPIGRRPDAAAFDPQNGLVFSSNGEGTLSVIRQNSADEYSTLETLPTRAGARTMALDAGEGKLYLATASFGPHPAPTPENPHPRPTILPGSFVVLVVGR